MSTITKKINSLKTLEEWQQQEREFFEEHKYINCKASDRRSLDQNALVHVWYKDIAVHRDIDEITVRRECKLNYGTQILRTDDEALNWVYSRTIDKIRYEKRLIVMDGFQITSIMSTAQLTKYLSRMEEDYPFLESVNKGFK